MIIQVRTGLVCALLCLSGTAAVCQEAKVYPDRWVHVPRWLASDEDVEAIREIATVAVAHGLNGMLLDAGLDCMDTQDPARLDRLKQVGDICNVLGIEIIPMIFSVGYGQSALRHNPNVAAALPVTDALFVVHGGKARLVADPPVAIPNGALEKYRSGHRFGDFGYQEAPGQISFVDTEVVHGGAASIRFQDTRTHNNDGKGRLAQEVAVRPHAQYRLSLWFKTEDLTPLSAFRLEPYGDQGMLNALYPLHNPTTDWTQAVLTFNSRENTKITVWVGLWEANTGKLWLDDIRVEEVGRRRIVRRPGTPLVVTSEDGAVTYEEGRDFARAEDPNLRDWSGAGAGPPLRLLPETRIKDGHNLRVSFYHAAALGSGQVSLCMSEPELYELWQEQARLIHQYLAPKRYFLDMDEIRAGGSCAACKAREMTMGEMLGDCVTKQVEIIRKVQPDAKVYIWSDMLDPKHNAHGNYYLVDGDFAGSWEHVPKDLVIVCWGRYEALEFFSERGFATMAAACCDGGDLTGVRNWLQHLDRTPGARGIIHTTWQGKYDLLAGFGDLIGIR